MLNKEEKRIIDTYILPALEKIDNIYFNKDKLYKNKLEFDGIPEGEYNKKVFPYDDVLGDLWDIVNDIRNHIKKVRSEDYVKKRSWEKGVKSREKARNRKYAEEQEINDKAYKEGREMAVIHYEHMKQQSRGSERKKRMKVYNKAYKEGSDSSKEFYKMTDEQILRKAKQIELEIELGFKKEIKKSGDKNE